MLQSMGSLYVKQQYYFSYIENKLFLLLTVNQKLFIFSCKLESLISLTAL